jgi:hypothetical protein
LYLLIPEARLLVTIPLEEDRLELHRVVEGLLADVPPPGAGPELKLEEEPAGKQPEVKVPAGAAAEVGLGIKPPKLTGASVTVNLPSTAGDVVLGGGGRFLLVSLPKVRKVALFDVNEAKVVHYFPAAADDVKVAAGLEHLVLVYPATKVVQRWNLLTRERERTATVDLDNINKALLGSASDGPLLLADGNRDRAAVRVLDLKTLKPVKVEQVGYVHRGFGEDVRVSADGTVFGAWGSGSPSGLQCYVWTGKRLRGHHQHESVGHIAPGPDGRRLFTGSGVYQGDTRPFVGGGQPGLPHYTLPAAHGPFYVAVRFPEHDQFGRKKAESRLTVHALGVAQPLGTLPLDPGVAAPWVRAGGRVPLDKCVHLIPAAGVVVTLALSGEQLLVRRFDPEEALKKLDGDYLLVTSCPPPRAVRGKDYVYPVVARSKKGSLQFSLEAGPAGMKVTKGGVVVWKPAADVAEGEHVAVVAVRGQAAQETYYVFKVRIEAAAAAPGAKK